MKSRIRNQKDFAAGVLYILCGGGFSLGALQYKLGEAARMGPGYFPFWVGVLLAAVGVYTLVSSLRRGAGEERLVPPQLRTMGWILGAVVLFGLLLQPAGLIVALVTLVIVSSLGSHEFTWRGTLLNAAVLTLFSVGAFVWGIHLQIPLWPSFFN
jgi:hypothetical protein